ncbi:hypothetical protein P9112_000447 [Eukaryota sp. TZLM1-RC]
MLDQLNGMRNGTSTIYFLSPPAKYITHVPTSFENFWRRFDDGIIRFLQSFFNRFWLVFDLILTFFTTVEFGMVAAIVLLAAGLDPIEGETSHLVFIVCCFSQIPKRFLWRPRPYMVGRAAPHSKPKTSSFPSRAVTCAAVYACTIVYSINLDPSSPSSLFTPKTFFIPLIAILLSSHARIQLGCHYPSDCLLGALNGLLSVILGSTINFVLTLGCGSCMDGSCYAPPYSPSTITWNTLDLVNWTSFIIVTILGVFLTIISVIKPIRFWCKCHLVYGFLLPCFAFHYSCLCKPLSPRHAALSPLKSRASAADFVFGLVIGGLVMAFGMGIGKLTKDPTSSSRRIVVGQKSTKVKDDDVIDVVESPSATLLGGQKKQKTFMPLQMEILSVFAFLVMHNALFFSLLYWRSSDFRLNFVSV